MAEPTAESSMPNLPQHQLSGRKLSGRSTTHGQYFEIKLVALLALRARRMGLDYQLYTSLEALCPLDDLVLRIQGERPVTYLVQIKHSRDGGCVSQQQWLGEKGDFALKKYFRKFKSISCTQNLEGLKDKDKQDLRSLNKEELRLVIFTNRIVKKQSFLPERDSALNFPYEDLFETGDKSKVFSFHSKDKEVWDLINDDDDYKDKFLPRLRVFGSQAHVDNLDGLMEQEINEMFGKPLSRIKEYVKQYIEVFKVWTEARKSHPITHSSKELERVLADDLRKRARDEAENGVFSFKDEHCESLGNEIHKHDTLLYQAGLVPAGHRVAKVQQVLDAKFPGRWVYVNDRIFRDLPVSALTAASNVCDVIVVDVNRVPSQVKQFLSNVKSMKKKIIVLSSESAKTTDALRGIVEFQHTTNEDWRLMHLTQEAQNKILEKMVEFQGSQMPLSALEDAWGHRRLREDVDGQLLSALLRGDATLGEAPAPPPDVADDACALRVPRTLVHHSVLRREALVQTHDSVEHFVLWGFSRKEVMELRRERGTREERFTEVPDGSECTEERALSHFNLKCSEKEGQNVHLVQNANGIFLWRATHGSSNAVEEFVTPLSETCERPYRCSSFFHEETAMDTCGDRNRPYLLLGVPGIGKSSYLYNLSLKQRENDPERWTVVIRLLDHLELIEKLPEPGNMILDDVERLIAAAAVAATPCAAAARRFLSAALLETGRVNLFVDGVDEVIPNFKDKALKLLELLVQHKKKDTLLWIASRPGVESLRQRLKCNSVFLQPLSYKEQLTYLKSKWNFHEGLSEDVPTLLAKDLVKAFHKTPVEREQDLEKQNDDDLYRSSLLAVPLNLRMAAEAFAEDARESLITGNKLVIGHIGWLHLVQRFIEGHRSRFRERYAVNCPKNQITNSAPAGEIVFDLIHQNYAMLKWTSFIAQQNKQQFEEAVKKYQEHISREKSGVLWKLEDGSVQFFHYVFVEYYVAMWIFQNFKESKNNEKFILDTLEQIYHSMVSLFLDLMLAENLPLHNAIIDGRNIDTFLLSNYKEVIDGGGRSALHLAAVYGRTDAVDALLNAGCDATKCDTLLRKTPLQYAATSLQLEVIEIFLQRKFKAEDLMSIQRVCNDPILLIKAVTKDLVEVMKKFLETQEGKMYIQDIHNFYPFLSGPDDRNIGDETSQIQQPNVPMRINALSVLLLHFAVTSGAIRVAKLLLIEGLNVNCLDELNQTPIYKACRINRKDILMTLVQQGVNVIHKDDFGRTPLHAAAFVGNRHIVKILIEQIPEGDLFEFPEMADIENNTPLHCATRIGHLEVAELLLDSGAH